MHLLLIHQAFATPDEPGGTRHFEFCRHLAKKGHQVTVVASNLSYLSGQKAQHSKSLISEEIREGVRILRVYTLAAIHISFAWRVISFIGFMVLSVFASLRVSRVDLVMGTSPPIFQGVSAVGASIWHRCPLLLEIRDLWPEFAIDMGVLKNRMVIRISRWLEGWLYRASDKILINSPAYEDYLVKRGISNQKVSLIPNGVDTSAFRPGRKDHQIREEFNLDKKFVVTYAGALGLANDLCTVLTAANHLRGRNDIQLMFVGDGKERKNLEVMAERLQLGNVIFAGTRPKSEMPGILAASNACLAILQNIPMFRTTYPNKVFDYMAAGRPTILAIDGVIRKVLEESKGGIFVPPGNDKKLAEAIAYLADHPEAASSMGVAARKYVVAHFDRMKHAEEFVALVSDLSAVN